MDELSPAPASPGSKPTSQSVTSSPFQTKQRRQRGICPGRGGRPRAGGGDPQRSVGRRWHAVPPRLPEVWSPHRAGHPQGSSPIDLVSAVCHQGLVAVNGKNYPLSLKMDLPSCSFPIVHYWARQRTLAQSHFFLRMRNIHIKVIAAGKAVCSVKLTSHDNFS